MVLEDSTVEYNEPSSSGCIEDGRDLLPYRRLSFDPEEEQECDYKGLTTDAVIDAA